MPIVNVLAGVPTVVARKSAYRRQIIIQNIDVNTCLFRIDGNPDAANLDFVLSQDTAAQDGNGGSIVLESCQGEVRAFSAVGTSLAVLEVTGGE